MRSHVFQGTLDELKPLLEEEARKNQSPALFISKDQKRFVIVTPTKNEECPQSGSYEIVSTDKKNNPIIEKFCTHD
jgi:hypothetical protein